MHNRPIPLPHPASVFKDISFNPNPIEEYVPMQPLHPLVFDRFCADGWCYWSDMFFRRNYWEWRDQRCRVVLLRIRLAGFEFSKSQRKCLRRNEDLQVIRHPLRIFGAHERLFERHSQRLQHHRPASIYGFFSFFSNMMPGFGLQFDVFKEKQLLATSFTHLGQESMVGAYGIHDPAEDKRSLGTFTMLKEIETAIASNRTYYYPGLVYDLPSEFDYKLNFNNLEYFDWWGNWYPMERVPVRNWRAFAERVAERLDESHPLGGEL